MLLHIEATLGKRDYRHVVGSGGSKGMLWIQGAEDQEEEKLFRKNVKILGFQMKVLVTLVKEFKDYLGSCVPQLVDLILTVQR